MDIVIAIYLRLSLEDNDSKDESNSISNQRLLLRDYIASHNDLKNKIINEYQDDGYSGTHFDRPAMKCLLADVKARKINCIIVKDFSRFARDYIELGTYLEQIFPFMGIRFISVNDNYDSMSHKGQTPGMDAQFKTLLYDFYSKDLSIKYKTAVMSKCERGEYVFGRLPLGYEKIPDTQHKIRINEYEANIVRRIFKEALNGKSTNEIAKNLHNDRVPTFSVIRGLKRKSDNREVIWQGATVDKILNNRFYIGEWTYNKIKVTSVGSKKLMNRPSDEWRMMPDHHESLVSIEDFNKVQENLASKNKNFSSNKRKREKHPFTGKTFCGGCGYALTYKQEYHQGCFRCNYSKINRKGDCCKGFHVMLLEKLILILLNKELLRSTELIKLEESRKQEVNLQLSKINAMLHKYVKSLAEKEEEKLQKYMEYACGGLTAERYKKEAKQIEEECVSLSEKVEIFRQKVADLESKRNKNYKDLKGVLRYEGVKQLTQEVVDLFVEKIYLYDGKRVEVRWAFAEA